ncbi:MAG: hypothetical protein IPO22_15260 [Anaerolineales bacterium]|nr:hypothetical protein [Anaerolineales bacterium]
MVTVRDGQKCQRQQALTTYQVEIFKGNRKDGSHRGRRADSTRMTQAIKFFPEFGLPQVETKTEKGRATNMINRTVINLEAPSAHKVETSNFAAGKMKGC